MDQEEILIGNRIIAEFWGYKHYPADKWYKLNGYVEHFYIENKGHEFYGDKPHRTLLRKMRFHLDWSWLMPVVVKIENLKKNDQYLYSVDMGRDFCKIETNDFTPELITINSTPGDKKTSVWKAVVQFIKWYNDQKNEYN